MLPRVPLASVLVEVDARTGFADHLAHARGKVARPAELKRNSEAILRGVDTAAEDWPALDLFMGKVGYGVVGPWWLELEPAVRSSPVVVPGIPGHHAAQVPFAEDQHPVGDLGPGR